MDSDYETGGAAAIRAVVCQQPFEQGFHAVRAALDMILSVQFLCYRRIIMENQIKILENL